jgi:protein ImuB
MGYAAIYIPEFPTLAWLRLERSARLEAVAVIEGKAPLERVISFNRAAKKLGLMHGMSKVQADTSGQVLFHQRCMQEEKTALEILFEAVERFSPRVQIIASPINGYANGKQLAAVLLVDQSGTETLFGDGRSYAEAIKKALRELDFPANVAVAPNAEASLLLARSYTGVTRVDTKEVQAKLAPLPLSMLSS